MDYLLYTHIFIGITVISAGIVEEREKRFIDPDINICNNNVDVSASGSIVSPNYENATYLPNTVCTWLLFAPLGESVRLTFNDFSLQPSVRCHSDSLRIYDGIDTFAHLLGNFCGQVIPPDVVSTQNAMLVVFRTDDQSEDLGFNFTYTNYIHVYPTRPYRDDGCHGDHKVYNATTGSISTPDYDGHTFYDNRINCTWIIQAPDGHVIRLRFEDFKTENNADCTYDYISVYDGPDDSAPKLAQICGVKFPDDIFSSGSELYVTFVSDADVSLAGVNMTYEFQMDTGSSRCEFFRCGDNSCVLEEMVCNGVIECPDGTDELLCAWDQQTCGRPYFLPAETTPKIVGGREVVPHSWPWMVSLQINGSHTCGGALIDKQWVVSAAHCFEGNRHAVEWTAVAGKHYKTKAEPETQTRQVERIFGNSKYNYITTVNDISLVKLSEPFVFNVYVQAICLPLNHPQPGEYGIVTGWGDVQGTCCPGVLKQAQIPIVDRNVCTRTDHLGDQVTKNMFCAGFEEGGLDACQGDSGGPFVMKDANGVWRISGITSFGSLCAAPKSPGVYTSVYKYLTWIRQKIATN